MGVPPDLRLLLTAPRRQPPRLVDLTLPSSSFEHPESSFVPFSHDTRKMDAAPLSASPISQRMASSSRRRQAIEHALAPHQKLIYLLEGALLWLMPIELGVLVVLVNTAVILVAKAVSFLPFLTFVAVFCMTLVGLDFLSRYVALAPLVDSRLRPEFTPGSPACTKKVRMLTVSELSQMLAEASLLLDSFLALACPGALANGVHQQAIARLPPQMQRGPAGFLGTMPAALGPVDLPPASSDPPLPPVVAATG